MRKLFQKQLAILCIASVIGGMIPSMALAAETKEIAPSLEMSVDDINGTVLGGSEDPYRFGHHQRLAYQFELEEGKNINSAKLRIHVFSNQNAQSIPNLLIHLAEDWTSTNAYSSFPNALGSDDPNCTDPVNSFCIKTDSTFVEPSSLEEMYVHVIDLFDIINNANLAIGGSASKVSIILNSNEALLEYSTCHINMEYCGSEELPKLIVEYGDPMPTNNVPTDILLSPSPASVNQSEGEDAEVGTLSTDDEDEGDTHTYSLVSGVGDADNDSFEIDGNVLLAKNASLMAAGPYSVLIRTTDTGGAFFEKAITITVVDDVLPSFTNSTPTLSNTTKRETTLTVRLDEPGTVYYVVVADGAAAPSVEQVKQGDNAQGEAALQSGSIEVGEAGEDATDTITGLTPGTAYDIYVVAEDSVSNTQIAVTKLDVTTPSNNVPTAISLNGAEIRQGAGENGVVGTLTTTDLDEEDTHTYSLVPGSGATHNSDFNINGNELRANDASQMDVGSYSVRIRTTDNDEGTYEQTFNITVVDNIAPNFMNGTPTLTNTTKRGTTLTVRLDEPGTVYYVVVADGATAPSVEQVKEGENAQGEAALQSGNIPVSTAGEDASTSITGLSPGTAYDIYVVAADNVSNTQIAVTKLDVTTLPNNAPTDIGLSESEIGQGAGVNGVVGTLTTIDADEGDTHVYTLETGLGDTDNARFNIEGDELRANNASLMAAGEYSVRIRTTDNDGASFEETFTITVIDNVAPEKPVITAPQSGDTTQNNQPTITGTAEADSTVEVFRGEVSQGTVEANGTGAWTFTPSDPWSDGTYNITATATDAAGNTSFKSDGVELSIDTTPPIITLTGESSVRVVVGGTYSDAGATATDAIQGNVSALIVVNNPVDTTVIGSYTITYNVTDEVGNAAEEVTRAVMVIPPAVTVTGSTNGSRTVTVSHAIPSAMLTLFNNQHAQVGDPGTAGVDGTFEFSSVPYGQGYTVTQTVYDISSDPSLAVGVSAPANTDSTPPANEGTVRQVPVAVDGKSPAEQVEIVRKQSSGGKKEDAVALDEAKTTSVVAKALEQGQKTASILINDLPDDPADEVTVSVPRTSVGQLSSNGISLEVRMDNVTIVLPQATLQALEQQGIDLFFRVVPIRDDTEKQQVETRTITAEEVLDVAGEGEVGVIGTPMVIETNYKDFDTLVTFPLQGIVLPDDPAQLQQLLDSLAVYIEHSDGEKKVQRGRIVFDENGVPIGIEILVNKFSTFTVFSYNNDEKHIPYIKGYMDGTFAPDRKVTRAELATMLSILLSDKLAEVSASVEYTDVADSHWAATYIEAMQELGLMNGYPDGTFRPDQAVTRAEFAQVAVRLLSGSVGDQAVLVEDIVGHWAYESIIKVLTAGAMSGYEDGTFRPNGGLTRAEAVSSLNRLFGRTPLKAAVNPYSDVLSRHWAYGDIMEASLEHLSAAHSRE